MTDRGPWSAVVWNNMDKINNVYVASEDFRYDACLHVHGDFKNLREKMKYAREIAAVLNAYIKAKEGK